MIQNSPRSCCPASLDVEPLRWLCTADGDALRDTARRFVEQGVAEANAQARLTDDAGRCLADGAARAARLAWTMAQDSKRAVEKLGPAASKMIFDRDGLQMASSAATADYHARIARASGARVLVDMTAGIGADTLALARAGLDVIAYEIDPARAQMLAGNVERLGLSERVEVHCGDALSADFPPDALLFLDPPRRAETTRWGGDALAQSMVEQAAGRRSHGVLAKLSPAIDRGIAGRFSGALEFVSFERECKEGLLRLGGAAMKTGPSVSAALLPSGARLEETEDGKAPGVMRPEDAQFLYEPDPAVIRAGLTETLARGLGLAMIDPAIAYLVAGEAVETPFAAGYRVLAAMPYHRKAVQAWLGENDAGALVVKKRGVPDDPEQVRSLFRLRGVRPATLALTRQGKRVWAIMLDPIPAPTAG